MEGNSYHIHSRGVRCPLCEAALTGPMYTITAELTFSEASQRFMDSLVAPGPHRYRKEATLDDYKGRINALNVFFADIPLREIHLGHFRQYQLMRAENAEDAISPIRARKGKRSQGPFESEAAALEWIRRHGHGYQIVRTPWAAKAGPNMINGELYLVQRFLTLAGLWTPLMTQQYIRYQANERDIPKALTAAEQDVFLRVASSKPEWATLYWYATLALDLCWSSDEMRTIRQGDVYPEQHIVCVNRKFGKNKFRRRETRVVTDEAMLALDELMRRSIGLVGAAPDHYLFPFFDRDAGHVWDGTKHMSSTGLRKVFDEIRQIAGVPWFCFNAFRHTGCSRLAEAGVPIAQIQARAGHQSPKMTEHYINIAEEAEERTIRAALQRKKQVQNVVPIWAGQKRLRFGGGNGQ